MSTTREEHIQTIRGETKGNISSTEPSTSKENIVLLLISLNVVAWFIPVVFLASLLASK